MKSQRSDIEREKLIEDGKRIRFHKTILKSYRINNNLIS